MELYLSQPLTDVAVRGQTSVGELLQKRAPWFVPHRQQLHARTRPHTRKHRQTQWIKNRNIVQAAEMHKDVKKQIRRVEII